MAGASQRTAERSSSEDDSVQHGTVVNIRKAFGFIRPIHSRLDIFFHYDHLGRGLDAKDVVVGLEVQYRQSTDVKGKPCAVDVRRAPTGLAQHEFDTYETPGFVIQWPGHGRPVNGGQPVGLLRYVDPQGLITHLTFESGDVLPTSAQLDVHPSAQPAVPDPNCMEPHQGPAAQWVLFKLCYPRGTPPEQIRIPQGPMGSKQGYRAVQVRAVTRESLDHCGVAPGHVTLLEAMGEILPR